MAKTALERYEAEQAKLRRHYGGDDEDDELFEVPKVAPAEVNPEVFKDVEPMLFRGFVYTPAEINGVNFVFKSLNRYELEVLGFLGATLTGLSRKAMQLHYSRFLAYGVLCVDGDNVLPYRTEVLPELTSFFNDLDDKARRKVIFHLSEINRRANRAVVLTEAFSMETVSRLRWAQLRTLDLMSPAVTGFPGTETLGLNWGQLMWRALNYYEDQREQHEREWENAKFVASSMAGKGMQKVHSQDKQRRQREQNERQERRDKIIRFALLDEDPSKESSRLQMKVARTVEELADQLQRSLKGEKDWHDMVVDEYEQKVRQQREARVDEIRQRYNEHQQEYGDRQVVGKTEFEGLSQAEVQHRITRRRQLAAQRLAAQQAYPEAHDSQRAAFLDKWTNVVQPSSPDSIQPTVLDKPRGLPINKGRG